MLKVVYGISLVFLLHAIGLGICFLLSVKLMLMGGYFIALVLMGLGILQALYVLPLAWYLHQSRQAEMLKGVLIAAGVTLMIWLVAVLALSL
jgi:hypothetical protein